MRERAAPLAERVEQRRHREVHLRGDQRRSRRSRARTPLHARQRPQHRFVGQRHALGHRELDDVLGAERANELARRAERDDPPLVDDGDAVAERLGLVHVVRRQEDRAALGA